jgi:hypothetical protein
MVSSIHKSSTKRSKSTGKLLSKAASNNGRSNHVRSNHVRSNNVTRNNNNTKSKGTSKSKSKNKSSSKSNSSKSIRGQNLTELGMTLKEIFAKANPDINFEMTNDGKSQIQIISFNKLEQITCLKISIDVQNRQIYINNLDRCHISGNQILKNVLEFAKRVENRFDTFSIVDASSLVFHFEGNNEKKISLKFLSLLSNANTWYTTHGFTNPFHENISRLFKSQISRSFQDISQDLGYSTDPQFVQMFQDLVENKHDIVKDFFQRKGRELRVLCSNYVCKDEYLLVVEKFQKLVEFTCVMINGLKLKPETQSTKPFLDFYSFALNDLKTATKYYTLSV